MKIFETLDVKLNQIKNFIVHLLDDSGVDAITPTIGQVYYNTVSNKLYFYDGSVWVDATDRSHHHGPLDMSGGVILNHGTPINATDVANKNYVDSIAQGISIKQSVIALSDYNISTLSDLITIDGISLLVNNRVLLTNQTVQSENGVYIIKVGPWDKVVDETNVVGSFWFVTEGSVHNGQGWILVNNSPISFERFSGVNTLIAGSGIIIVDGTTISVDQSVIQKLLIAGSGIIIVDGTTISVDSSVFNGLPTGGNTGQILIKNSNDNYDASWVTSDSGLF